MTDRSSSETTSKSGALGLTACIALVVGNMIGSGVFLLPASLAPLGPIAIGGWILTSAGALVLAIIFGRLSRVVSKPGGPYAYSQEAFGDFAGFIIAWGYWIALWTGNAAVAVALVGYLGFLFPDYHRGCLCMASGDCVWLQSGRSPWSISEGVEGAGVGSDRDYRAQTRAADIDWHIGYLLDQARRTMFRSTKAAPSAVYGDFCRGCSDALGLPGS